MNEKNNINWLILFYSSFYRIPLFTRLYNDLDFAWFNKKTLRINKNSKKCLKIGVFC